MEIELKLEAVSLPIFDGRRTDVWKIYGNVLKGAESIIENTPGSYLGPTIYLHKGQKVRIYLRNNLPVESILHWHGLHVPPTWVATRGTPLITAELMFTNSRFYRAGTYFYHTHPHHITGEQVYMGLAGFMIVSDNEEKALGLPKSAYDISLIIGRFASQNQIVYVTHTMQRIRGFLDDRILSMVCRILY